jgi:hypothetical protein
MNRGTIAVDLDDVLAATNKKVSGIHNEMFGTDMSLDDFDYCERSLMPVGTPRCLQSWAPVRSLVEEQVGQRIASSGMA